MHLLNSLCRVRNFKSVQVGSIEWVMQISSHLRVANKV